MVYETHYHLFDGTNLKNHELEDSGMAYLVRLH